MRKSYSLHFSYTVIFIFVLLQITSSLEAQTDSISNLPQFLFPNFTPGIIKLKTGEIARAEMNYNTLSGNMTFFKDNVLHDLNKPEVIDTIFIQNRQFVYTENEFFEVIVNAPAVFFIQHKSKISSAGRPGAYGTTSQTSGPTALSKMYGEKKSYNFKLPDEIILTPDPMYWVRINNTMHKFLTVRQFLKIFPGHEDEIKSYIKQNDLSLDKRDDLIKLGIFCNKLNVN
jgi:hypothetical protein